MILVWGKASIHRELNLGCRGAESPGWLDVLPKKFCMRRDAWVGALKWWSCQLPVAHSCSLLSHLNSFHGGMFKLNPKFDADLLLYSLNHFECDGHTVTCSFDGVYCPHWLVQWMTSCHCSHMCIPVHSPWLPGFIDVTHTILIIFTMAWHFLDSSPTAFPPVLFYHITLDSQNFYF